MPKRKSKGGGSLDRSLFHKQGHLIGFTDVFQVNVIEIVVYFALQLLKVAINIDMGPEARKVSVVRSLRVE